MKKLSLGILFVIIILETSVIPYSLTVGMLAATSLIFGYDAAVIALICGIVFDLFSLRLIGETSLYFLLLVLIAGRYQRKIFSHNQMYAVIFLGICILGYQYMFFRTIDVIDMIISLVVSGGFLLLLQQLQPPEHRASGSIHLRTRRT